MNIFFIASIIIMIIFMPIPIKCNIHYSEDNYYIKLYGFINISPQKYIFKKKSYSDKKNKDSSNFYKKLNLQILMKNLYNLKSFLKPILRINASLNYSLNDAAKTAIFYGLFNAIPPLIYILLTIPFNIKKFILNINPVFEDKFLLKFEISSIIFLSFANIIIMIFSLFKIHNKTREVTP